jgi:hypothetical protein
MGGGMMSGAVVPEPGPNMMWNTEYEMMDGMMGAYNQGTSVNDDFQCLSSDSQTPC